MKIKGIAAGEHISTVATRALEAMKTAGMDSVTFDFNRIEVTITLGMTAADACDQYHRKSKERHEAYIATPEYKTQQEESARRDRERRTAYESALSASPKAMSLKDPEGWAKTKEANTDPYGGRVMTYAEEWARLMEGALAKGATVAGCAKEMSHLADYGGITGFMYGAAVATLALVWAHGEELRRWHNKDIQIGDEGDRANETGGTLNPALLTVG